MIQIKSYQDLQNILKNKFSRNIVKHSEKFKFNWLVSGKENIFTLEIKKDKKTKVNYHAVIKDKDSRIQWDFNESNKNDLYESLSKTMKKLSFKDSETLDLNSSELDIPNIEEPDEKEQSKLMELFTSTSITNSKLESCGTILENCPIQELEDFKTDAYNYAYKEKAGIKKYDNRFKIVQKKIQSAIRKKQGAEKTRILREGIDENLESCNGNKALESFAEHIKENRSKIWSSEDGYIWSTAFNYRNYLKLKEKNLLEDFPNDPDRSMTESEISDLIDEKLKDVALLESITLKQNYTHLFNFLSKSKERYKYQVSTDTNGYSSRNYRVTLDSLEEAQKTAKTMRSSVIWDFISIEKQQCNNGNPSVFGDIIEVYITKTRLINDIFKEFNLSSEFSVDHVSDREIKDQRLNNGVIINFKKKFLISEFLEMWKTQTRSQMSEYLLSNINIEETYFGDNKVKMFIVD